MSGKFGGGGAKCTICSKTTYPAETVSFEKKPYHDYCFKCTHCKKKMTPDKAQMHEDQLYDRMCYRNCGFATKQPKIQWTKKEPKKGSGGSSKYGGGGVPCTVCGKKCHSAEQVSYDKLPFHAKCFLCSLCQKKMTPSEANKYEAKYICSRCWHKGGYAHKQVHTHKPKEHKSGTTSTSSGSGRYGGGGTPCHACTKTVYSGEKMSYEKNTYHPKCFRCSVPKCKKQLTLNAANQYQDKLFCNHCFAEGHYSQKQSKVKTWTPKTSTDKSTGGSGKYGGGGVPCEKCKKTVYSGEKVSYDGKTYHPGCITCSKCNIKTDTRHVQKFKEKLYCQKCWKTEGFSNKQAKVQWQPGKNTTTNTLSGKFGGGGMKCVRCSKSVYPAEKNTIQGKIYHSGCIVCTDCKRKIASGGAHFDDALKCPTCWTRNGYARKQLATKQHGSKKTSAPDSRFTKFGGGGTKCYSCSKTVYPAEQLSFEKHVWHGGCFKCKECGKKMKVKNAQYTKHGDDVDIYDPKCFHKLGLNRAHLTESKKSTGGDEPTGDEPTGDEPTGDEPTGDEKSSNRQTLD